MEGQAHVIVAGHITFSALHDFIFDFFHEDHGLLRAHVVLLSPDEPSLEMRMLLHHPRLGSRMQYLQASVEEAFAPPPRAPPALSPDRCVF